jgi:uncharacterized protein with HEPN domain
MSKEPIEFLKHIADECSYLLSISNGLSKDAFLDDETLKRAVVRSLEIYWRGYKENSSRFQSKMGRYSMEEHFRHERSINP